MVITIVIPCSRPDYLKRIFAQLDMMPCDREKVNILVFVDGNQQLFEIARNLTVNSKFNERLCVYRHKGVPSVGSVKRHRQRIADVHNDIKPLIKDCDYIFLLEDDTLPPLNTLEVLVKNYSEYPFAGFISAVEIGRWGYEMIGGWCANDVYNPEEITSIARGEGIVTVDAAGLYCCLIKRDHYMKHFFKPFQDILGPDVDFGLELRKQGYFNYVNHDLKCKHLTKRGEINFQNAEIVQVQVKKLDHEWSQGTV